MSNLNQAINESEPEPTGLSAKISLKDELVCEECEKSLEDPETGVTSICIPCWNAMITKLRAEIEAKDVVIADQKLIIGGLQAANKLWADEQALKGE